MTVISLPPFPRFEARYQKNTIVPTLSARNMLSSVSTFIHLSVAVVKQLIVIRGLYLIV
jgi:hypothetical protein